MLAGGSLSLKMGSGGVSQGPLSLLPWGSRAAPPLTSPPLGSAQLGLLALHPKHLLTVTQQLGWGCPSEWKLSPKMTLPDDLWSSGLGTPAPLAGRASEWMAWCGPEYWDCDGSSPPTLTPLIVTIITETYI